MYTETIQLKDLTIGYPGKRKEHIVARHINAEINRGEMTCMWGEKGVGKGRLGGGG